MKFGFYSPYLDTYGGGERYMLTLASHVSQNHQVDIFWNDQSIKPLLARFLKIDLSKCNFVQNIITDGFSNKLATLKYDWTFILSDGSIPTTLAKKNILHFQVPFKFNSLDFKTKLKLKKYNWVIVNSNFTKEYIDKSFNVVSKVIYPPVDIKSINPGIKEKVIVSVGRFSAHQLHPKKQEILIEVFKEIYKKAPDWKLVLAGQAKKDDQKYLRALRKSARGFAIKIMDNMPVENLRKLYATSSIYWHATGFGENEVKNPERMEHFGISTVEAQAAGAVPVVIAKGGQKEIVIDGKNGRLWETKSQLYETTLELISDQQKLHKLSGEAVKNSKRFSQELFFKEYEQILL